MPITAMATVIPNDQYHIKLVIADDQDTLFDSAVFLSAGSFDIGTIDLGDDILLTSGNANCLGDEVLLGLQQLNVGRAAEAGIAIVLLAIVLDRITQSYGETLQERNSPTKTEKK